MEGHILNFISSQIVQSSQFIKLFQIIHTGRVRLLIDFIIFLFTTIAIITVGISGGTQSQTVNVIEIFLYLIILMEIFGKLIIVGPRRIWSLEFFKNDIIVGLLIIFFGIISTNTFGNVDSLKVVFRYCISMSSSISSAN